MKIVEQSISNTSFIHVFFRLFLIRFYKHETIKRAALISVVLCCTFTRYWVLSQEQVQFQNKQRPVSDKYLKSTVWLPEYVSDPNGFDVKKSPNLKFHLTKFKRDRASSVFYTSN